MMVNESAFGKRSTVGGSGVVAQSDTPYSPEEHGRRLSSLKHRWSYELALSVSRHRNFYTELSSLASAVKSGKSDTEIDFSLRLLNAKVWSLGYPKFLNSQGKEDVFVAARGAISPAETHPLIAELQNLVIQGRL
jgi:hypothetical protein